MAKILPGLVAALLSAGLLLAAGGDQKAAARPLVEVSSPAEDRLIMGYGREWSVPAEGLFPGFVPPPAARICAVIGGSDPRRSPPRPPETNPILQPGSGPAQMLTVEVNSPDAPVLLLLTSDRSTLWRIETTPGTEVAAAAASGPGAQAVMGLKPEVPVLADHGRGEDSWRWSQFYSRGPDPQQPRRMLENFSRKTLGRKPDLMVEPVHGSAACGWAARPGTKLLSQGETDPGQYDVDAGFKTQLEAALNAGLIRRARPADLNRFTEAASMPGRRLLLKEGGPKMLGQAYVAESSLFVLPRGPAPPDGPLARLFTFFIPPGLSLPPGPIEGLRVLFLEDGTCLGRDCGLRADPGSSGRLPGAGPELPPACRFEGLKLPPEAKIYVGGVSGASLYQRRKPGSDMALVPPGPERVEVTVNSPGVPAVLILAGSDSAEWHFDLKPGSEVAAVLMGGYYASSQRLVNLPAGVPVLDYNQLRCVYFTFSPEDLPTIGALSRILFGRAPDRGFQAADGRLVIDPALPRRAGPPAGASPPPDSSLPPKKPRGLDLKLALENEQIRPASSRLRAAWLIKHAEQAGWGHLMEPADFAYEPAFPVYEILSEAFVFTRQMTADGPIGFILPENSLLPGGDPGRAVIHFMDDGLCWGPQMGCDSYGN